MIKALLLLGGKKYELTDRNLKNWDEIEQSMKRKNFGGVYRTFTNKYEFVNDAYFLLQKEWEDNYLNSSAVIVIGVLNNSWTYNQKIHVALDFSTFQMEGSVISLNAVDNSLESIINAKKSQVYDIPVNEIKYFFPLYFERMELKNSVDFILASGNTIQDGGEYIDIVNSENTILMSLPIGYGTINFPVKNIVEPKDDFGEWSRFENVEMKHYFIKAISSVNIKLDLSFSSISEIVSGHPGKYYIILAKWTSDTTSQVIEKIDINNTSSWKSFEKSYNLDLSKNNVLTLTLVQEDFNFANKPINLKVKYFNLNVSYTGKNKPVDIDAISAGVLLNRLLSNMGLQGVTGVIKEGDIPIPYIVAAESIRGIKKAKIHTSFSKFADWAKACLGYEYKLEENKVVFTHITNFYDPNTVLELEHVNSIDISVDTSLIFSGVEVGYDKKDYDEINGRDEFHVKNSFSTGLAINDNIYKIISPFRADCYGIEFLAQKRDEETKDNASDNDVFIVDAELKIASLRLFLKKESYQPSGVLFPESIFNVAYSPRRMLIANKEYLSVCSKTLTFTASEGNGDAVLRGLPEKKEVVIEDRFFTVEKIKAETIGLSPFPYYYSGLISFEYNGKKYFGYLSEITEKIGKLQSTSYSLIGKKNS